MRKIRMAFIGCGQIGRTRAATVQALDNQEVALVMDVDPAAARSLSEQAGVDGTTDLDDVLNSERVDAVYICTPHACHAEAAIRAAASGKHVLVEKPLATSLDDGVAMIRACREAGVVLAVGYQRRWREGANRVRSLIRDGAIGEVTYARSCHAGFYPDDLFESSWLGKPELSGGGALFNTGMHNIDLVRYATGLEADEVFAHCRSFRAPAGVDDVSSVLVTYRDSSAVGHLEVHASAAGGARIKIGEQVYGQAGMDIYGTEGRIRWDQHVFVFPMKTVRGMNRGEWNRLPYRPVDEAAALHRDFADAVLLGKTPRATGEDGLAAIDLALAAYESSRTHVPVKLKNMHLERRGKR